MNEGEGGNDRARFGGRAMKRKRKGGSHAGRLEESEGGLWTRVRKSGLWKRVREG